MPAVIITVVVVALIWGGFLVFAVGRPAILDPRDRRAAEALPTERVEP
ncbi:hypothetical protein OG874_00695 [Nocardia sp. NBC_00565]|nr:hypothetical protein [Nocardia sp. NBC_00565]WUC03774.1 hypothetical protein OG874_00695 [Nocardia sp. NBC_00565]